MNKDLMAAKTASITPEVVTLTSEAILAWLATSPSEDNTLRTSTMDTHLWIAPSGTERSIVVSGLDNDSWRLIAKVLVPAYEPVLVPLFWSTIRIGASSATVVVCGCTSQANLLSKPVVQIGAAVTATTLEGGTKAVGTHETAVALVATSTPCKKVWIGAPFTRTTGLATNAAIMLIGDSASQNIPLHPSDIDGFYITIDDAAKIYIYGSKIVDAADAVNYRIFV